jgi:predicted outer membrane protein
VAVDEYIQRVDLRSVEHHDEIMKLLESLVADKEALQKSNTELQELLSESREAIHMLQEEAGERLADSPSGGT